MPDGDTSSAVARITVDPAPDATSETLTIAEDSPTAIDIFANETDPGSGLAAVTFTNLPAPAQGSFTYTNANGDVVALGEGAVLTPAEAATLVFTPAPGL